MVRLRFFSSLSLLGTVTLAAPLLAQTRVACVGDSITEGYGLPNPQQDAYPRQLQTLLGSDYQVGNYGVSGTTAQQDGDKPYWAQAAFTQSTSFDPDWVLLMLGTNDGKPQNWNETQLRADYLALVEHYVQAGAQVLVATPPKVFASGAFDIDPGTVNDAIVPLVRSIATERALPLVDVFTATAPHAEWFADNVHPDRDGAAAIAGAFADALRAAENATEAVVTSSSAESTPVSGPTETTTATSTTPTFSTSSGTEPRSEPLPPSATTTAATSTAPGTSPSTAPPSSGSSSTTQSNAPTSTADAFAPTTSSAASSAALTTTDVAVNTRSEAGCSVRRTPERGNSNEAVALGLLLCAGVWSARRGRPSRPLRA